MKDILYLILQLKKLKNTFYSVYVCILNFIFIYLSIPNKYLLLYETLL